MSSEAARGGSTASLREGESEQIPDRPTSMSWRAWRDAIKRAVAEFRTDNLTDWAAALTYYSVLSIFPALLVLISIIGLIGPSATDTLIKNVQDVAPGAVQDVLVTAIQNIERGQSSTAGLLAVFGLLAALWSASSYIAAFMRASNAIYDVPEGRPIWKTLPIRIGLTVLLMLLTALTAIAVVMTGGLARRTGEVVGAGDTALTVWEIAKWPVLLIIVSLMFALLYWASPNARQGIRWITPGGIVAVVLWLIASGGFAVYVGNFGSYNKTYGSLAAVIIFLVWLWITNIAILLGAELNAELERSRAITVGHPKGEEPYVPLRDTRKIRGKDYLERG
jgi:YihY family inner membrane protein